MSRSSTGAKNTPRPRLAVSVGDPAGIGPEVVLKALARPDVARAADFLLLGNDAQLAALRQALGLPRPNWRRLEDPAAWTRGVCLFDPAPWRGRAPALSRVSRSAGAASLAYVKTGVELCRAGVADGLVTGPICKAAWKLAGAKWPGHTELLAELTGTRDYLMMLAGGGLRVALVTIHCPLSEVPARVTGEAIRRAARVLDRDLRRYFGLTKPRLAVLGLNPHAGEGGHIGREELEVIAPAVRALRRAGLEACGPLPADTAFHFARQGEYDAILAMYHDQGLGPLKTVAFDQGINVTLGLPIIRTSVDHGTAFDRAGRGEASPNSCIAAIRTAADMARQRKAK